MATPEEGCKLGQMEKTMDDVSLETMKPETIVNYDIPPETIVNYNGQLITKLTMNQSESTLDYGGQPETTVNVNNIETTVDNENLDQMKTSVGDVEVSLVKVEVEDVATQVADTDLDVQEETINLHQILEDEAVFDYDFEPLPNGEFVSGIEAYEIIKRHDHVFQECPKGPKSNIWFLVDNSENLKRKSDNCKCHFNDDCGAWDNTTSRLHHSYYHMTNKFKLIFKRADVYCSKIAKHGGTCYVPYEPQPEESDVLHMIRYATTLKSDPKFHKHVTYFTCPGNPHLGEVALYEYLGSNAGNMPSKNMKRKPISRDEVKKKQEEIKRRKEGYSEQKMEFDKERLPSPASGLIEKESFMTAFVAFDKIVCHQEVYEECPPGNKSNMWLLVDNSDNIKRVSEKQKRNFYDDCGVWNNRMSRTHVQYYLLHDNFRIVLKKDGIYCTKKTGKGKNLVHVPLNPQPKEEDVVEMYRYQTCLASNPDFKKHVTYFTSSCDPQLGAVAIYEYVGTYNEDSSTKVRTRPKVLEKMRGDILSRKTGDIYSELAQDLTSTKQVRNMKYREKYLLKHGVRPGVKKDANTGTIKKMKIASTEKNANGKQKTVFHIISN